MIKALGAGLVVALMLAAPAEAQSNRRFQCWTDEQGNRACGDRVPPEAARKERQVLDNRGNVVEVKPREKTAAEREEEARKQAELEAAKRAEREAAAYDRFLIDTYSGIRDLERARDERISMLNGRLRLTEKAVADDEKALVSINGRVEAQMKEGKLPDKALRKQQRDVQRTLRENRQAIEQIKADRQALQDKFARDIQRYQELRSQLADERAAARRAN